jgi:hypothetical protein
MMMLICLDALIRWVKLLFMDTFKLMMVMIIHEIS